MLIGNPAPTFLATAVVNNKITSNFSLAQYKGKKEVVFFFYPKDFTFVCPTELLAFQRRLKEFENKNVAVVACSTDTEESHLAWLNTPVVNGGIQGVTYPIVADTSKVISANYGVLGGSWEYDDDDTMLFNGIPVAYRGLFFIDIDGIVRHQTINDLPLGRNIEEVLRIVYMWQHVKTHGEVCPANWREGHPSMKPTTSGVCEYLKNEFK